MIKIAQLKQLDMKLLNRFQPVLEVLLAVEKEAEGMIAEIERVIAEHDIKGEALKREAAEQRVLQTSKHAGESSSKGKDKQREKSPFSEDDEDEDEDDAEDSDLPKTPAGKEHRDKRSALMHRLREARVQFHRVKFLQGDVYHNLGEMYTAQENGAYAVAEAVRRNLLKSIIHYPFSNILNLVYSFLYLATEQDAKNGMAQLHLDIIGGRAGVSKTDLLIPVPYLEQGGIRSADTASQKSCSFSVADKSVFHLD